MRFSPPLIPARFVRRYKRFLADFTLGDGSVVTGHCANPGSMLTCLEPGARAWLSRAQGAARKLPFTWQLAEVGRDRIYVYPVGANQLVREGIERGVISELAGYSAIAPEVRRAPRTRLDFALAGPHGTCFVEVKNATLRLAAGCVGFPDARTERGVRHLAELERARREGHRAVLFFCVSRSGARGLAPADAIDPAYGQALRHAVEVGVEVLAYRVRISPREVRLVERVPVRLG